MRVLIIADIDDLHWLHGPGQADLILSCGDVADQVIQEAAVAFQCANIFAVKGNHDPLSPFPATIIDLHMTCREYQGITFGGLNGAWLYKPRRPFLYEQSEVSHFMSSFPAVDVLISHNSPKGIHDRDDHIHDGFEGLTAYIAKAKPKMLIHGHQHVDCQTKMGETTVIGVYGFKLLDI